MRMVWYVWGIIDSQVGMEGMYGESLGEEVGKGSRRSYIMKDFVCIVRNFDFILWVIGNY